MGVVQSYLQTCTVLLVRYSIYQSIAILVNVQYRYVMTHGIAILRYIEYRMSHTIIDDMS